MSYVMYSSSTKSLVASVRYCEPTGQGFCISDIVVYSAGRLVSVYAETASGGPCPSDPVKYDSATRRLYRSGESTTCFDVIGAWWVGAV
jgi:hypothetical protein